MSQLGVIALGGWLTLGGLAEAQVVPSASGADRNAYDHVMVCFAANMTAARLRRDRGDAASAARYEANAERSHNYALAFGQKLGLTRQQIDQSFDETTGREAAKLLDDPAYLREVVARCRALDLM